MVDNPLKRFIGEIHRRSIWQVLGIYGVAFWGVLSVVDTLGGTIGLPDWFPPVALALLVIGLPVVLATAFVQQEGLGHEAEAAATDPETAAGASVPNQMFAWRNALLGGLGALAFVGAVAIGAVVFGGGAGTAGESGGPTSIEQSTAVLPFDDLSPEGNQQYFRVLRRGSPLPFRLRVWAHSGGNTPAKDPDEDSSNG